MKHLLALLLLLTLNSFVLAEPIAPLPPTIPEDPVEGFVDRIREPVSRDDEFGTEFEFAKNKNFTVVALKGYSQKVLDIAEKARKDISTKWLGEVLIDGIGFTHINVDKKKNEQQGFTMLSGGRKVLRGYNRMFITCGDKYLEYTIIHEVGHAVLNVKYPNLPLWVHEGICTQYDYPDKLINFEMSIIQAHQRNVKINLKELFELKRINPSDIKAYAVSHSIVKMFTSNGGNISKFMEFVDHAKTVGWDASLKKYYRVNSIDELQSLWKLYVLRKAANNA